MRVKLCADKTVAQLKLAELVKRAGRERLGLFDPAEDHARRPLADHLNDYEAHLRQRGNSPEHVRGTVAQIRAVAAGCGWVFTKDVDAPAAAEWLYRIQKPKTQPVVPPDQERFTVAEVAALLELTPAGVWAAVQRNRLAAVGAGKA